MVTHEWHDSYSDSTIRRNERKVKYKYTKRGERQRYSFRLYIILLSSAHRTNIKIEYAVVFYTNEMK